MIQQQFNKLREFAEYAALHAEEQYLSLYLNTDPADPENQNETPAWQIFLKNAVADIESGLDPAQTKQWKSVRLGDNDPDKQWARIRKRADKYLTSFRPSGKTLAVFISPSGEYRFELPVGLASVYHFGRPHIQEFLWALDEHELHMVALMAEDEARVLRVVLGRAATDTAIESDQKWMRQQRKAAHHQNIEARKDELTRRFVRAMADDANKFFLQNPDIERVVLGGDQRLANSVLGAVHPSVKEKVIAVLPIPADLPASEIAARIRGAAEQAEREHEETLVANVLGQAKAGGRGATGSVAVGRALERAAVRLIALPYPTSDANEPLLLQAVQQGSRIEFLHGRAAEQAQEAGGIIAELYYAIN
jgi:hypothetical protein